MSNYCKSHAIVLSDLMKSEYQEAVMRKYGFRDFDAVYAAIAHGGLKEGQVINKMKELYDSDHRRIMSDEEVLLEIGSHAKRPQLSHAKGGIIVRGITDLSVHFSKCCSPLPGDEIIGYITRGRGVSIHRSDCINVMNMSEIDRERLIEAEWLEGGESQSELYLAELNIYARNRAGLLNDVSKIFSDLSINISQVNCRVNKQDMATISLAFNIHNTDEFSSVVKRLRTVPSVIDIERTTG